MHWLWRLSVLLLLLFLLLNNSPKNTEQAFINWISPPNLVTTLESKVQHWQKIVQDLPANIEVEIRKIWNEAKPKGNAMAI